METSHEKDQMTKYSGVSFTVKIHWAHFYVQFFLQFHDSSISIQITFHYYSHPFNMRLNCVIKKLCLMEIYSTITKLSSLNFLQSMSLTLYIPSFKMMFCNWYQFGKIFFTENSKKVAAMRQRALSLYAEKAPKDTAEKKSMDDMHIEFFNKLNSPNRGLKRGHQRKLPDVEPKPMSDFQKIHAEFIAKIASKNAKRN